MSGVNMHNLRAALTATIDTIRMGIKAVADGEEARAARPQPPPLTEVKPLSRTTPEGGTPSMPRAPRQCPRCSTLIAGGQRYCDSHQPIGWDTHPSKRNQTYTRAELRSFRTAVLKREPACRICGEPTTEADHVVPVSRGGTNDPESNGQGLCSDCHAAKTRTESLTRGAPPPPRGA